MHSLMEDVKKLPVAEKANLFLALKLDTEMKEYLHTTNAEKLLLDEISRRDVLYKNGNIYLTTTDELTTRLKARRDVI